MGITTHGEAGAGTHRNVWVEGTSRGHLDQPPCAEAGLSIKQLQFNRLYL